MSLFDMVCSKVAKVVVKSNTAHLNLSDEQIDVISRQHLYGRMLKREKVLYTVNETGKVLYGIELNVSIPKGKKAKVASKIQKELDPFCQVFYWTEDGPAEEILFQPCDLDEWERRKPLLDKFAELVIENGGKFVQAQHVRCSEHYYSRKTWGKVFLFFAKEMANVNHIARRKSAGWWNREHRYWGVDVKSCRYWSYLKINEDPTIKERLLNGDCSFVTRYVQDACAFCGETEKGFLTHVSVWKSNPSSKEIVNRIAWYDHVIKFANQTSTEDMLNWDAFSSYLRKADPKLSKWMEQRMSR